MKKKQIKYQADSRRARKRRNRRKRRIRRLLVGVLSVILLLLVGFLAWELWSAYAGGDENRAEAGREREPAVSGGEVTEEAEQQESSAEIHLAGDAMIRIKLGETYSDPGYEASDEDGTDLSDLVQVDTGALNRAGVQKVIYRVQGNNGVMAETYREVEVLPNTEYETPGLPICMYHYVYDPAQPPEDLNSNYISTTALAEEMQYLHDNGYYFPTWQEVRDYVDGRLLLPEKSIVLTFDDGPNYMYLGTPILEQYQTPATSFVIASYWDSKEMLYGYASDYLTFESHSYKMHQGGGNIGHGGIYTAMSREQVLEDLQKSFEICGNHDAFAYPFGDYTEEGCSTLEEAGLLCAVTTENAKCYPGDNPYLLPRVRMQGAQSLEAFIASIS